MIEINWTWVLIVIILLISVDKIITVVNIKTVEKNFPKVDRYSIEKNPVAKQFFKQFGLVWGTLLYGLFSFVTFLVALLFLKWTLSLFNVTNAFSIALWIMIIFYGVVISNNFYFLLKFSKVIP